MATSGKIVGSCTGDNASVYNFTAEWVRNSDSVENNTSNITIALYVQRNDGYANSAYNLDSKPSVTLKVGGASKTPTKYYLDTRNSAKCKIAEWTGDVTHNDDGSLSLDIYASFTHSGSSSLTGGSLSGNASITTIPRASKPTVSASSVQMGYKVNIFTNRKADSFTHTLTYSFGGTTRTIATNVGTLYTWTVPDLASKISGQKSGTCTITCKTYSGTTLVGTQTVSLTLTIQDKSTLTASASSVQMGKSVTFQINRKSSHFTHKITYKIGTKSGDIGTGITTSKPWTPDKSLAHYTGNELSATCTITCYTYTGSTLVDTSASEMEITLTVPDATVPKMSASTVELGKEISVSLPRETDAYVHDLAYTFTAYGSATVVASGTFATNKDTSHSWTDSLLTYAPKIPAATKGTFTIICTTHFKDSTTVVGTKETSYTVTVPNNTETQPKVTMTLSCVNDGLDSEFNGIYIQGKSKVKVSYTASSDYSEIASYSTTVNGNSGSDNPYTSPILSKAETVTITGLVKDKRGYSTQKTDSITVIDYDKPRIIPAGGQNKIICTRCNSDGGITPDGDWLLIRLKRKYSKVISGGSQKNFCKISYCYKTDAQDDADYSYPPTILIDRTDGLNSDQVQTIIPGVVTSRTTAYNIKLIAEDDVGETDTVVITVPTVFTTFHSPEGGHGFTLGGYHDPAKYDVFDCYFKAEFENDVYGTALGLAGLPGIPIKSDLNEYKNCGAFAVYGDAIAAELENCPVAKAGTLRVWSANGRPNDFNADHIYRIQEYICYNNGTSYRRYMMLPNGQSSWEFGEWHTIEAFTEGETDGWHWKKYANGNAECWRRVNQTGDITTAWGSLYYGECKSVDFPFKFVGIPACNISVESGTSLWVISNGITTDTKPADVCVARISSLSNANFTIIYHVIGRWQ